MTESAQSFERDRHLVLRGFLEDPGLSLTYRYAQNAAAAGITLPGDEQVSGTPCSYGDTFMDGLLNRLLPKVEQISGLRLFPTYSYFRVYKHGDTLRKHTDRPSCEISLTLCLGYDALAPWPILIQAPKCITSISLEAGDGLLYRGIECLHWRSAFDGRQLAQVFLHYVDQDGPYSEWRFDKRTSLAQPKTLLKARYARESSK
jgi:hypothetical protein